MKASASAITFTAARTATVRDDYLLAEIRSGDEQRIILAAVELVHRWADPPVPLVDAWEIPSHELGAMVTSLCAAIWESRQVTGMLASALQGEPPP